MSLAHWKAALLPLAAATLLVSACGDSDGDGDDGGAGSGNSSGQTCYNVDVNTTEGGQACGPTTCPAGQYCDSTVGICDNGCEVLNTCPTGQFCDKSTGAIGTCRPPGPENEVPCSTGTGTDTGTGTSTGTADCQAVCEAKAAACGGNTLLCAGLCMQATQEQLDCLEAATCQDFADGEECGFSFTEEGEGG